MSHYKAVKVLPDHGGWVKVLPDHGGDHGGWVKVLPNHGGAGKANYRTTSYVVKVKVMHNGSLSCGGRRAGIEVETGNPLRFPNVLPLSPLI